LVWCDLARADSRRGNSLAIMIGWWPTKFIAMIVGVAYPSLESYKALKTETKDDDVQVRASSLSEDSVNI
jgi:hypothetical protein